MFVEAISTVEQNKTTDWLNETKFITIISDGSTDISVQENELVFIRSAYLGVQKLTFSSIENVKKADAEGIMGAVTNSMKQLEMHGDFTKKVVAFAADGASVNSIISQCDSHCLQELFHLTAYHIICLTLCLN